MLSKKRQVSIARLEQAFVVFSEKPSDRYGFENGEEKHGVDTTRINAFELFSKFTADIIKEQTVFTR